MNLDKKQKLVAYLSQFLTPHRFELMDRVLAYRTTHVSVMLEDIYQPHNASAVLRSCEIFGVQDVHIVEDRNRFKVTGGVAMGSAKWLTLTGYKSITDAIDTVKKNGYQVVATTPHKRASLLQDISLEKPMVLVFGTEHIGLSDTVLEQADEYVKIPMFGFTQSFNVSVSVALCLQHIIMSLHNSDIPWRLDDKKRADIMLEWLRKSLPNFDALTKTFLKKS